MNKFELQELLNLTNKKLAVATKNMSILQKTEDLIYSYRSRAYDAESKLKSLSFDSERFKTLSSNYDALMLHYTMACEAAKLPIDTLLYKHILKMQERISELEKKL